ncbi:toll-like receptor 13 [Biomphalaria pfeifferi]|uniref:Toll-like receptor 13 n=1 Tax=Biomphalaria pfeifferi TaxID=112525 RepID=A0AAD8B5B3_BIOPF|nr:toll-like receptor 13 [Biomphalaria pfeifferi]
MRTAILLNFKMATFFIAKILVIIVCNILGLQCSYIASDSKDEYLDAIQNVGDLYSREFNRYRRKGTSELKKQFYKHKSLENTKNVILRDINISINVGSECHVYNLTVDCSKLNLKEIDSSWFSNNTEMILLNDNLLIKLVNSTFVHLSHLTHLDLSNNEISLIDLLAFDGLTSLKYLSLRYNSISFNAVSTNILEPLNNLQLLDLIQKPIAGITDVPVSLLQSLTKLRTLAINTFNSTLYFGHEFLNLTHLEVLEITGSTRNVTESSFKNVNGLKQLIVRDMQLLKRMDDKVFVHLDKLTSLTMAYVSIDLQRVLALLWPFKGRSMSEIYFEGVTTTFYMPNLMKNGYMTKKDLMYATDICLDTFTVIDCNIYYITANAVSNRTTWDRCLRNIYFSRNSFIGSAFVLFPVILLQNLTKLTVSDAIRTCQTFIPFPRLSFLEHFFQDISLGYLSLDGQTKFKNNLANQELSIPNGTFYVYVSKSLTSWNLKRLVSDFSLRLDVTFCGADNLQYIDISDSGFHTFTGHIRGLSSVKTAIVSGNDISHLSENFLDELYGLENLAVSKCQLDRNFIALKFARILQNTTKLKVLDISNNSLNVLSKETFAQNSELLYLSLSGNQFKDIPFDLKFTPNLKILDLSSNIITTLTPETTKAVDFLNSNNKLFQLMLNGNMLSCGCHDLSFLQWLNSTLVSLDNNRNYTCMNKDGERTNTLAFSDLESLWRQCWGEFFFYVALITLCLYVIGAVLIILILRNKNFFVSYFLQIFGNSKLHTRFDYKTDVYIGYSEEDYRFPCIELREHLEKKLKLNTFLIDRDLLASLDKASGIMDAINSCWRVLLVCSKSFLTDEDWSMFTMRSAMYAQNPANPARIVIMVHTSCLFLLPSELLSVVNDENILVVSEWKINYILSEKLRARLMA